MMNGTWTEDLERLVTEETLFETKPSLCGVGPLLLANPPSAVFLGIGLCTHQEMSSSLPIDVLGMLLPAESLRSTVGASELLVLVADVHARLNGFSRQAVEARASKTVERLVAVRDHLDLRRARIIRASDFCRTRAYQEVLREVDRRSPDNEHPYVKQQVADVAYLSSKHDGLIKVGWTLAKGNRAKNKYRDETAFDQRVKEWLSCDVGFVYCKAGRTLDPKRPKAAPYITTDVSKRLCLDADEDVKSKLLSAKANVGSVSVLDGAVRYYESLTSIFSRFVGPLDGPIESRLQTVITDLTNEQQKGRQYWSRERARCAGSPASLADASTQKARAWPRLVANRRALNDELEDEEHRLCTVG